MRRKNVIWLILLSSSRSNQSLIITGAGVIAPYLDTHLLINHSSHSHLSHWNHCLEMHLLWHTFVHSLRTEEEGREEEICTHVVAKNNTELSHSLFLIPVSVHSESYT